MLLILALFQAIAAAQTANLAIVNANIYTVNAKQPKAKEIAIANGRILAVGDSVRKHIGRETTVIDAHGATIIPGLIDSHGHVENLGMQMETFDFRATKTVAEIAAKISQAARTKGKGEWIVGRSWDQTNWGGAFPDHRALTAAAPDNPVYLTRVDGHAGWVNRKAMEIAGLNAKTADPSGGKIVRDGDGQPTGILIDRAQGLVQSKIPAASDEQNERRILLAAKECAQLGLTSVHDAGVGRQTIESYKRLIGVGKLPLRVYAMVGGEGALWNQYLKSGPQVSDFLTVRSIKLMVDGALGSRGALLWQPYSDDKQNSGLTILQQEDIERVARAALKAGFQVNTHAIGDRANRIVLNAYGAVLGASTDKRFRVEHAQAVALPDFALFAKYGVIASMQSTHATSDMRWAEARLGPDRLQGAYAPNRFLKMGVKVANGSDFPVEEPNPLLGFFAAVSRQDVNGFPAGGWRPDQKLTREESLYSWTMAGAYAAFEEQQKGSLEVGKLGDLVMLSADIMKIPELMIPKASVTMTVVGGRIVHRVE